MLESLKIRPVVESQVPLYTEADTDTDTSATSDSEQERACKQLVPKKSPDIAFHCKGLLRPPFLIEIAFSQKAEELPRLAAEYYKYSNHECHTVVTVDIGYLTPSQRTAVRRERKARRSRKSTQAPESQSNNQSPEAADVQQTTDNSTIPLPTCHISLYRDNKPILDNHMFRDSHGQPVEGSLDLSIADFVPAQGPVGGSKSDDDSDSHRSGSEANVDADDAGQWSYWHPQLRQFTFTVTFTELCESIAEGEELQELEERTPPRQKTKLAGGKRRDLDTSAYVQRIKRRKTCNAKQAVVMNTMWRTSLSPAVAAVFVSLDRASGPRGLVWEVLSELRIVATKM